MKTFEATKRDNERNIMRLELTGDDIETLGLLVERLEVLLKIEEAMDSVAVEGLGFLGHDLPHITEEAKNLIIRIVDGWDGDLPDPLVFEIVTEDEPGRDE